MSLLSRRSLLKLTPAMGAMTLPLMGAAQQSGKKLKIVCVGGHPDDPESGCGGTLAAATTAGHVVTIIYLTRGEAGIEGMSHTEAGAIRTKEATASCAILKAKPVFAGQVDGSTVFNQEWVGKFKSLIQTEMPDLVFTHWPIDTHPDHQVASLLTINAWVHSGKKFPLYFYEVCAGEQTLSFKPTDYVDITDVREVKQKAVYCHKSQDPDGIYACGHTAMEQFRGLEAGVKSAEGFVKMTGKGIASISFL